MKSLLLAGSMLAMIGTAQAANFTVQQVGTETHLHVTGKIVEYDEVFFLFELILLNDENKRPDFIFLNSPGGDLETGLQIGMLVRKFGLRTVVLKSCSSVCSMIWLAGTVRWKSPTASIGFHAAYYADGKEISPDGNAIVGGYLSKLGYNYLFIRYATSVPPNSMRWLTEEDAKRYGLDVHTLK
jgi:hypothetical protein